MLVLRLLNFAYWRNEIERFKYIVAVLLLAVFPITALGFDISISKCQYSGKVRVSVFGFNTEDNCCCKTKKEHSQESKSATKAVTGIAAITFVHSSINNSNDEKLPSCCSKKVQKEKLPSCCQKPGNNNVISSEVCNIVKDENSKTSGKNVKPTDCCTHTLISNDLSRESVRIESISRLITETDNYQPYIEFKTAYNHTDIIVTKVIDYPLKEPITYIISFILLSSSARDDGDDISSFYFC